MQKKVGLYLSLGLAVLLSACAKPQETVTEYKGGELKIEARTQEYHNSGIKNVDVCAMTVSSTSFPKENGQCFLSGYDFSGLSVKWKSPQQVEISFDCGRVSSFKNFALVPGNGGQSTQIHAELSDGCDRAKST
jgi:hypothetical protein